MKLKTLLFIFVIFLFASTKSQTISGVIIGTDKQPIPFATIYIQQLKTGTASNDKGKFEIKAPTGIYDLEFRALGYKTKKLQIELHSGMSPLAIELEDQVYSINEIIVKKGDEDPAYAFMRKAISLANYYRNQVKHYTCNYYIRYNGNFITMPNYIKTLMKWNKVPVINSGDVYFTESVNEVTFDAPDKYFQKVISFKSTFPDNNKAHPMLIGGSFYDQKFWGGISPLAPNAFSYYKFKYQGVILEKGFSVLKIQVTPKFTGKNLYTGNLYLVDKTYNIYSVDLSMPIEFGKSYIKQQFVQVMENIWLPVSFSSYNDMKGFGAKAAFNIASSIKYVDIQINKQQLAPDWLKRNIEVQQKPATLDNEPVLSKKEKKIRELLSKENLSNREMLKLAALLKKQAEEQDTSNKNEQELNNRFNFKIEKDAIKADSNFWNEARPIPLTVSEVKSVKINDSLRVKPVVKIDTSGADSTFKKEKKTPKVTPMNIMLGHTWRDTLFNEIKFSGIIDPGQLRFNTVDGFVYGLKLLLLRNIDSTKAFTFEPRVAYAFSRKEVYWNNKIGFTYSKKRMAGIDLEFGHYSKDFNNSNGVSDIVNTFSSLFFRTNYLKLYDAYYFHLNHTSEITNAFIVTTNIAYDIRSRVENHTVYSFFYKNSREYTPNTPANPYVDSISIRDMNTFAVDVKLEYTPNMYYRVWNHNKYYAGSKFPTFSLQVKQAVSGVLQSGSDYLFMAGGISQQFKWGIASKLKCKVNGGGFIEASRLHFADYYHPSVQESPVVINSSVPFFSLLKYYEAATPQKFIEGHISLTAPYIALKFLPLLNLTNLRESISLSALTTPSIPSYFEVGYGISNLPIDGTFKFISGFDLKGNTSYGFKLTLFFKNSITIGGED